MQRHAIWILGCLVVTLACFVASTFSTWLPMGAVMALAVLVVFARSRGRVEGEAKRGEDARLPRWLRWSLSFAALVIILAIISAWRLGDHFGESINPVLVGIDIMAHVSAVISLVIWAFRPSTGHVSMLLLGMAVTLLCVAAGGTSQTLVVQTTVGLLACLGFAVASQIILGVAAANDKPLSPLNSPLNSPAASRRVAPLFSLLTLSLILMATSAIAKATNDILPSVRDNLQEQLKSTLDAVGEERFIGGTRYVRGSKLGSIRQHMLGNPQELALRVYAKRSPGYLRGTVFDIYRRRRWFTGSNTNLPSSRRTQSIADRSLNATGKGRTPLVSSGRGELDRFQFRPGEAATAPLEIRNEPLKGNIVFMPLAANWLEGSGSELVVSHHDVVRLGIDVTQPYVVGVGARPPRQTLDQDRRRLLLDLGGDVSVARTIADQVCRSDSTPRAKADSISRYFQRNFTYSLTATESPENVDPLTHFLESKHPAHCEFFATATVLMLRSVNVPCRYVTGYVSTEYGEQELCWLARNRDAHAWVEAYDDVSGRWFPVESTPGRTYLTIDPLSTDDEDSLGGNGTGDTLADENETILGWLWNYLTAMRATDPLIVVFRFAQGPLFLVVVVLLYLRFWRRSRVSVDREDAQSRRMLRQVDRLSRKHRLVRLPHETLHQFADRIEKHVEEVDGKHSRRLFDLARWYRQFAEARYQGALPLGFEST